MKQALHKMNPSVKFLVITVCMLTLAFFFNPWTPLICWGGVILLQLCFSTIDWKKWLLFMIPFLIMSFGYFWTTIVFAEERTGAVVWSVFQYDVTRTQLDHALSLSFRVLAFAGLSLLFAFTTDPTKFILSLMQQLKLSPKIAYSILVGYQFLPVMKEEFVHIQQAHRLRGAVRDKNAIVRLWNLRRILLPMLAGAVRKAERSAFAMEARGFTGEKRLAFYQVVRIGKHDFVMSALFFSILAAGCAVALR
ncbi:energy-coupling factor transporter transmembrane component T family protein [Sporosarcina cyprini]|uniref:energy-coupling factor transporter transmembrane component T family protein n=1 Tax=Sporosarcina cyprini TaxID=2910523 RepID=UPI001EE05302|nr:energy-coupling factor transporter transmembrane component T [Sporosarcina cyprini]MCG3086423.1 energy-coupling factor transporter transmembrane protein EcfT [Sporosarcina cyprini]